MQPLHFGIMSIPGSPKTWTWKQSPILAQQITEKSQKGTQGGSQETPKMTLKSIKIHTWTSKCLLGDPLDPWITKNEWVPWITKMVNLVTNMEPQGLQNDDFGRTKLQSSAITSSQGGRRQGRSLQI